MCLVNASCAGCGCNCGDVEGNVDVVVVIFVVMVVVKLGVIMLLGMTLKVLMIAEWLVMTARQW